MSAVTLAERLRCTMASRAARHEIIATADQLPSLFAALEDDMCPGRPRRRAAANARLGLTFGYTVGVDPFDGSVSTDAERARILAAPAVSLLARPGTARRLVRRLHRQHALTVRMASTWRPPRLMRDAVGNDRVGDGVSAEAQR